MPNVSFGNRGKIQNSHTQQYIFKSAVSKHHKSCFLFKRMCSLYSSQSFFAMLTSSWMQKLCWGFRDQERMNLKTYESVCNYRQEIVGYFYIEPTKHLNHVAYWNNLQSSVFTTNFERTIIISFTPEKSYGSMFHGIKRVWYPRAHWNISDHAKEELQVEHWAQSPGWS